MIDNLPAPFYTARAAAALEAAGQFYRGRNNCHASAAYWRDCARAAIRDVRECAAALGRIAA